MSEKNVFTKFYTQEIEGRKHLKTHISHNFTLKALNINHTNIIIPYKIC